MALIIEIFMSIVAVSSAIKSNKIRLPYRAVSVLQRSKLNSRIEFGAIGPSLQLNSLRKATRDLYPILPRKSFLFLSRERYTDDRKRKNRSIEHR